MRAFAVRLQSGDRYWTVLDDELCVVAEADAFLRQVRPFMPVLQGWQPDDYLRCADLYDAAGSRLEDYPVAGLGSVCCKQGTKGIALVAARLTPWLTLHGFGVSSCGLLAGLVPGGDARAAAAPP